MAATSNVPSRVICSRDGERTTSFTKLSQPGAATVLNRNSNSARSGNPAKRSFLSARARKGCRAQDDSTKSCTLVGARRDAKSNFFVTAFAPYNRYLARFGGQLNQ